MRGKLLALLVVSVLSIGGTVLPHQASAVTAADWQAGRIIDDTVFTDNNAMTAADVQNFLNQKVGTTQANGTPGVCDTNGTQTSELGGGTRAQYGAAHGNPTPFTCLKDYYEVPKTTPGPGVPASNYGGQPIPAGAISAAQIIWNAAQQNNINPRVLITLIQKESAGPLITDDWPFKSQYNYALGSHCPDSTGCDPNYAGFSIQVYSAAGLLRYYLDNMTQSWWPYKKLGSNNILYSPISSCGSSPVNITTSATAGLYTYTPYQPNQAALNNMYGRGDGCSAYGNRNFWRIYSDWFGSTYAPAFSAQPVWQQIYTDSSKSSALGWNATLLAGKSAYAVVVMKNTGNTTWTKSGAFGSTDTRLATAGPWGRSSAFCDGNWVLNCTRPAALQESSVAPGAYGTFEFSIRAPEQPGNYSETFAPVVDGRTVFSSGGMAFNFTVTPATFAAQPVWQQIYTDSSKSSALGWDANLMVGQSAYAVVVMKNTGNMTWTKSGAFGNTDTRLATAGPWGRSSAFCTDSWLLNCNRPAALQESSVAPGQFGTFEFPVRAPNQPGNYSEAFAPIVDGRTVFSSGSMALNFNVAPATFSAQPVWQQVYSDSSKSTALGWNATLSKNQTAYLVVAVRNTGNIAWTKTGAFGITDTRLATFGPWGRSSKFCDNNWLINCLRPSALTESSVAPGAIGTFEFPIKAPATTGTYAESFAPVVDGRTIFNGSPTSFILTVQ